MKALSVRALLMALVISLPVAALAPAFADSRSELDASSKKVLNNLVAQVPAAKAAQSKAIAVLVFPNITKAGLVVGGQ